MFYNVVLISAVQQSDSVIHTYIYIYIYIYIYTHSSYRYVYIHIHIYVYAYTSLYILYIHSLDMFVCVCVYIYIYIFFSITVYHRILNIVLCAIQEDLVIYPFCILKLTSANPNLPLHPFPNSLPIGSHQ